MLWPTATDDACLFTIGLVIFTLGSLLCGFAQSPLMLTLSRRPKASVARSCSRRRWPCWRTVFAAKIAASPSACGVRSPAWPSRSGPILGGVITSGINWRAIFLVNIPIGIIAVAITLWKVEESKTPDASRPDWAGFILLTLGLGIARLRTDSRQRTGLG